MQFKFHLLVAMFILTGLFATAQINGIVVLDSGQKCSIRGMSIPTDKVIWASGSNGHVARSINGGKTWEWLTIKGYEKTDFRDIHALNATTAIIMGIGNPANILKTKDGGQTWKLVFTKDTAGMFLDAMDFRNDKEGICIGDPLAAANGKKYFFVIRTNDGGETWTREPARKLPAAAEGEAIFSASGTNISLISSRDIDYAFISGGMVSNLYFIGAKSRAMVYPLSINQGSEGAGAFSMATDGRSRFFCIGGDYKNPEEQKNNFVWTIDNSKTWKHPVMAPLGYRSCIRIIHGDRMIACGTSGVDICEHPDKWKNISKQGFNVCMVSRNRSFVFFGGGNGKIGVLRL